MASSLRNLALAALAALAGACASDANSIVCPTTGIVCPEGTVCAAAQPVCLVSSCGNGVVDVGEQCDDGNIIDGDRCSSLCRTEECGNGIVDGTAGEKCDDGNAVGGDGCSEVCTIEACGNGRRDSGEECDDGNLDNGDGCTGTPIEISDGAGGTQRSPEPCKSTEVCGNGIKDFQVGEVCDDGNTTSGDGCNSDCRSGEGCGNGILDPGEECDDGNEANTDRCLNDCTLSQCGDGIIEAGRETCDAGDRAVAECVNDVCDRTSIVAVGERAPVETVDCNIDCTISTCGDRRVNTTDGEECDAGAGQNLDSNNCTSLCKFNFCGDGKKDTQLPNTEACDDGNTDNLDECSNGCQIASCGNSTVDNGEQCDDGNTNSDDLCVSCQNARCGDGYIQAGVEECDGDNNGHGDTLPGDGCSATCRIERCGNSVIDPNETCDDGQDPVVDAPGGTTATQNSDACINSTTLRCINARCGDGYLRTGVEACDDGNNADGDGCSASCQNEGCGNGILETIRGEQCDDHNVVGGDGCSATCQLEDCGDGVVDVGEECDGTGTMTTPGVGGETATCNANCTIRACGDGIINNAALEQCDDGKDSMGNNNNQNNRDCRADCRLNFCTDGFRNTAGSPGKREACDDGNQINNDECSNACALASCGNGLLDTSEECDLGGNNSDTGACTTGCKINVCGDGNIRAGVEECDPGTASLSTNGPCLPGCRFARCGDGAVQDNSRSTGGTPLAQPENCDNGIGNIDPANPPACPYGAQSCTQCSRTTCRSITYSGASSPQTAWCGDAVTDGPNGEACDKGSTDSNPLNNNGATECAYNATSCTVCNATCTTQSAGRVHKCGDNVVDNGQTWGGTEICDDGNTVTETMAAMQTACTGYNTSCAFCSATCGAVTSIPGPRCGDGTCQSANENNTTCPTDCTSVCGNSVKEVGEQCDNGNGTGCPTGCTVAFGFTCTGSPSSCTTSCGDGKKASTEACDDGNTVNGDGCSMTTCVVESGWSCTTQAGSFSTCTRNQVCGDHIIESPEQCDDDDTTPTSGDGCSMTCTREVGFTCATPGAACTATCGDGIKASTEACDDGNAVNGDGCTSCVKDSGWSCTQNAFGLSTCTATMCGDGIVAGDEVCDDHNALTCGTCNSTCSAVVGAKASGLIVAVGGASLVDEQTFTVNDGVHPAVTFEFDVEGGMGNIVTAGAIKIDIALADTPTQVATKIATAITNASNLDITPMASAAVVFLTNDTVGAQGNQTITDNVVDAEFFVSGMGNGAGNDCAAATGCNTDADCASTCNTTTHMCN